MTDNDTTGSELGVCSTVGCYNDATVRVRFEKSVTFDVDYCEEHAQIQLEYDPSEPEIVRELNTEIDQ